MISSVKAGKLADFPGAPEVHVLGNGQRVITMRGAVGALTGRGPKRGDLARYVERLPSKFKTLAADPNFVRFETNGKRRAVGADAEWFIDVCHAYVEAAISGKLRADQVHLARNAAVVIRAVSKIGIIMLIDRATGYKPPPTDLDAAIKRIVRFEMRMHEKTWEHELAQAIAPLIGQSYDGVGQYPVWMKGIIGEIYDMLFGKTAMDQIRAMCPYPGGTHTRHQYLTDEARDYLRKQQPVITAIARTCRTLDELRSKLCLILQGDVAVGTGKP